MTTHSKIFSGIRKGLETLRTLLVEMYESHVWKLFVFLLLAAFAGIGSLRSVPAELALSYEKKNIAQQSLDEWVVSRDYMVRTREAMASYINTLQQEIDTRTAVRELPNNDPKQLLAIQQLLDAYKTSVALETSVNDLILEMKGVRFFSQHAEFLQREVELEINLLKDLSGQLRLIRKKLDGLGGKDPNVYVAAEKETLAMAPQVLQNLKTNTSAIESTLRESNAILEREKAGAEVAKADLAMTKIWMGLVDASYLYVVGFVGAVLVKFIVVWRRKPPKPLRRRRSTRVV